MNSFIIISYLDGDLLLDLSNYRHAKNAINWCKETWGKVDNSIWRYTDNITNGEIIFEFINDEMKVEFLLIWG